MNPSDRTSDPSLPRNERAERAISIERLPNGLNLLIERVEGVRSAALSIALAAGATRDPADAIGTATVLSEMTLRGAGSRDSRTLTDHLDMLGLQRHTSAGLYHIRYIAAGLAERVMDALPTYADILQHAHLDDDGFDAARELAAASLDGLSDDPRTQVMIELYSRIWPDPLGRNPMGTIPGLEAMSAETCRAQYRNFYVPHQSILAISGDVVPDEVRRSVLNTLGQWQGTSKPLNIGPIPNATAHAIERPSEQTHIGFAFPSVLESHPDYVTARLVYEAISGGGSSRLFVEVREKRGLCYSVGANYASVKERAAIVGYAGTTPERAQETLDQVVVELRRAQSGITREELERARIGIKAGIFMALESTQSRAGHILSDFFTFGRVRSTREMADSLDRVTLDDANRFLAEHPPAPLTLVTLGPKSLSIPS